VPPHNPGRLDVGVTGRLTVQGSPRPRFRGAGAHAAWRRPIQPRAEPEHGSDAVHDTDLVDDRGSIGSDDHRESIVEVEDPDRVRIRVEDVIVTYSMFACAFRDDRVAAHATKLVGAFATNLEGPGIPVGDGRDSSIIAPSVLLSHRRLSVPALRFGSFRDVQDWARDRREMEHRWAAT
jgi:hypothetical protein